MKIDIDIYNNILEEVLKSANTFDGVSDNDKEELQEDFNSVMNHIDINSRSSTYTGGVIKNTADLLMELKFANANMDKEKCIESIAMIRATIMDVETALSNATDCLEKVVVSIRDA